MILVFRSHVLHDDAWSFGVAVERHGEMWSSLDGELRKTITALVSFGRLRLWFGVEYGRDSD